MFKSTKGRLTLSALSLLVCISMFVGSTFAWFTDSVSSVNNIIKSGNLDVVLEYKTDWADDWAEVTADTKIFDDAALYEPGYVETVFLRVSNAGSLALKYDLNVNIVDETEGTNVYGNKFKLSDYLEIGAYVQDEYSSGANYADLLFPIMFGTREAAVNNIANFTKLGDITYNGGSPILPGEKTSQVFAMVLRMPETVGNEANHLTGAGNQPSIKLGINLLATQLMHEKDSFGNDYDEDAEYDVLVSSDAELDEALATLDTEDSLTVKLAKGDFDTNFEVAGGKDVEIVGSGKDTVLSGQIATTASEAGTVTLKNLTVKVDSSIVDSTGISQTGKSAIAIWGNQTVICENVTFDMSLADSTAITSWWDTGKGTSIIVRNCTFNCNGQRPIRATGNVTVENCTFNDPYRYAVQLTAKASTATELDKATVNFKNNKIVNGPSGKAFVYGIQLEGESYGCSNLVINGAGNTIENGGADSAMYYCECGKVDHATVTFNTEVTPVHEN